MNFANLHEEGEYPDACYSRCKSAIARQHDPTCLINRVCRRPSHGQGYYSFPRIEQDCFNIHNVLFSQYWSSDTIIKCNIKATTRKIKRAMHRALGVTCRFLALSTREIG